MEFKRLKCILRTVSGTFIISMLYVFLFREITSSLFNQFCDKNRIEIKKNLELSSCNLLSTDNCDYFKTNCTKTQSNSTAHIYKNGAFVPLFGKTCTNSEKCNYLFFEKDCEFEVGKKSFLFYVSAVTILIWFLVIVCHFSGNTMMKKICRDYLRFYSSPGDLFKDPFLFCNFLTNEATLIEKGKDYVTMCGLDDVGDFKPIPRLHCKEVSIKMGIYSLIQSSEGLCVYNCRMSQYYGLDENKCLNNMSYLAMVKHDNNLLCVNKEMNHHFNEEENIQALINEQVRFVFLTAERSCYAGDINTDFILSKFLLPFTPHETISKLIFYNLRFFKEKGINSQAYSRCLRGDGSWYERPEGMGVSEWRRYTSDFKSLIEGLNITDLIDKYKTQSNAKPSIMVKEILQGSHDDDIKIIKENCESKCEKDLVIETTFEIEKNSESEPSEMCLATFDTYTQFLNISDDIDFGFDTSINGLLKGLKPNQGKVDTYLNCFPHFNPTKLKGELNTSVNKKRSEVNVRGTYAEALKMKMDHYKKVDEDGTLMVKQELAGTKACKNAAKEMLKNLGRENSRGVVRDAFDIIIDSRLYIETLPIGEGEKRDIVRNLEKIKNCEKSRAEWLIRNNYFDVLKERDNDDDLINELEGVKHTKYKLNLGEYLEDNLLKNVKANKNKKKRGKQLINKRGRKGRTIKCAKRIKRGFDLLEGIISKSKSPEGIKMGKTTFKIMDFSIKFEGENEKFSPEPQEQIHCSQKDVYKVFRRVFSEAIKSKGNRPPIKPENAAKARMKNYENNLRKFLAGKMSTPSGKEAFIKEVMQREVPEYVEFITLVDKMISDFN